jgi:hypothetical protein
VEKKTLGRKKGNMAREVGSSPQKQAELLKDQGNRYFKKDRLAAAIDAYTEVVFLFSFIFPN